MNVFVALPIRNVPSVRTGEGRVSDDVPALARPTTTPWSRTWASAEVAPAETRVSRRERSCAPTDAGRAVAGPREARSTPSTRATSRESRWR
nr:hypothetical protein [Streptomyces sp. V2]